MTIEITRVEDATDRVHAMAVRATVFVQEQNVSPEEEADGLDEECIHYLVRDGVRPIGAGRVRMVDGMAKIERVAIEKPWRGKGIGKMLMDFIMSDIAANTDTHRARLGAQDHAIPFYERLGFQVRGDGYMDAGIPHHDMEADIKRR